MFRSLFPNRRLKAAGLHLLASVVLAAIVSALVFGVWYPSPFATVAGGSSLFVLLIGIDVVMGPALTAVIASPTKPMAEFRRDFALIVLLQLAALVYGLYTMALARPVYMAFEVDRMRVVIAADVDPAALPDAPPELRSLPWFGPRLIAAVKPDDPEALMRSVELGLAGVDLSMVPGNWRGYASQAPAVWTKARPVALLVERYPPLASDVAAIAATAGKPVHALRFLPLVSRQANWVTLLVEPGAQVVGHLPASGFF